MKSASRRSARLAPFGLVMFRLAFRARVCATMLAARTSPPPRLAAWLHLEAAARSAQRRAARAGVCKNASPPGFTSPPRRKRPVYATRTGLATRRSTPFGGDKATDDVQR